MEGFGSMRHEAFGLYKGFDMVFPRSNNFVMDIEGCVFQHGNCTFKILPVATASEYAAVPSVKVFGPEHPMDRSYPQLTQAIKSLGLPTEYYDHNASETEGGEGATSCFKFGFQLTALVCRAVRGKVFASVCPKEGTWLWFVILKPTNKLAARMLEVVEKRKAGLKVEDSEKWYQEMGFEK